MFKRKEEMQDAIATKHDLLCLNSENYGLVYQLEL